LGLGFWVLGLGSKAHAAWGLGLGAWGLGLGALGLGFRVQQRSCGQQGHVRV